MAPSPVGDGTGKGNWTSQSRVGRSTASVTAEPLDGEHGVYGGQRLVLIDLIVLGSPFYFQCHSQRRLVDCMLGQYCPWRHSHWSLCKGFWRHYPCLWPAQQRRSGLLGLQRLGGAQRADCNGAFQGRYVGQIPHLVGSEARVKRLLMPNFRSGNLLSASLRLSR